MRTVLKWLLILSTLISLCIFIAMTAFLVDCQRISAEKKQNFEQQNSLIFGPSLGSTEYTESILAAQMQEDFIYYSDISILGNFNSFYMQTTTNSALASNCTSKFPAVENLTSISPPNELLPPYVRDFNYDYKYTLYAPYSSSVELLITHNKELTTTPFEQLRALPNGADSVRHYSKKLDSPSVYYRNGLTYLFGEDGTLYSIFWKMDDITYSLTTYFSVYPTEGGNAIIQGLLSTSDAEAVMAFLKLKAYIKLQQDPAYYTTIVIFTCSCLLVSIISLSGFTILGKRRKKKATMHQADAMSEPISEE